MRRTKRRKVYDKTLYICKTLTASPVSVRWLPGRTETRVSLEVQQSIEVLFFMLYQIALYYAHKNLLKADTAFISVSLSEDGRKREHGARS